MAVYQRDKRWYVDVLLKGEDGTQQRIRRSAGQSKTSARELEKRLLGENREAAIAELGETSKRGRPSQSTSADDWGPTVGKMMRYAVQRIYDNDRWGKTARYICLVLTEMLGEQTLLSEVNPQTLVSKLRKERKLSDSSIRSYLSVLNRVFEARGLDERIRAVRAAKRGLKTSNHRTGSISPVEQLAVMKAVKDYQDNKAKNKNLGLVEFFQILFETGMRRGELQNLTWERVNLEKLYISIPKDRSKRDRAEKVAITPETHDLLKVRRRVMTGAICFDISDTIVKKAWAHVREQLGNYDPNFVPHQIRHTFGTRLYAHQRNIRMVQKALRHTNLSTTLRYEQEADEDAMDEIRQVARATRVQYTSEEEAKEAEEFQNALNQALWRGEDPGPVLFPEDFPRETSDWREQLPTRQELIAMYGSEHIHHPARDDDENEAWNEPPNSEAEAFLERLKK